MSKYQTRQILLYKGGGGALQFDNKMRTPQRKSKSNVFADIRVLEQIRKQFQADNWLTIWLSIWYHSLLWRDSIQKTPAYLAASSNQSLNTLPVVNKGNCRMGELPGNGTHRKSNLTPG